MKYKWILVVSMLFVLALNGAVRTVNGSSQNFMLGTSIIDGSSQSETMPRIFYPGEDAIINLSKLYYTDYRWHGINKKNWDIKVIFGVQTYQIFQSSNEIIYFKPPKPGNYRLEISTSSGSVPSNSLFFSENFSMSSNRPVTLPGASAPRIFTDKDVYRLGDTVLIFSSTGTDADKSAPLKPANDTIMASSSIESDYKIEIISSFGNYQFLGQGNTSMSYRPRGAGLYQVRLTQNESMLDESNFTVTSGAIDASPNADLQAGSIGISLERESYAVGEPVTFRFTANITDEYAFIVESGDEKYTFLSLTGNSASFVPKKEGDYLARLMLADSDIAAKRFSVAVQGNGQEAESAPDSIEPQDEKNLNQPTESSRAVFLKGQDISILFDFSQKIERTNIFDKLLRLTNIETATAFVEGHESDHNFKLSIMPLTHNKFIVNITANENVSLGLYSVIMDAKYGDNLVSDKRAFEITDKLQTSFNVQADQGTSAETAASSPAVSAVPEENEEAIVSSYVYANFPDVREARIVLDFSQEASDKRTILNDIFRRSSIEQVSIFINEDPDKKMFSADLQHLGGERFELLLRSRIGNIPNQLFTVTAVANIGEKTVRKDYVLDFGASTATAISQLEDYGIIETKTRLEKNLKAVLAGKRFELVGHDGKGVKSRASIADENFDAGGKKRFGIAVELFDPKIRSMDLEGFDAGQDAVFGLDKVEKELPAPRGEKWEKVVAFNPMSLNFSNGTLRMVAEGRQLFKCKDWDFAGQQCNGEWAKIKDLVVGQPYSIELSPDDPAFAESGLMAINTNKSIFLPNETALIAIGLLDNNGRMVCNANISMVITEPDGHQASFSTYGGGINISPECDVYGYTTLPDYYLDYYVGPVGTYQINASAAWSLGTAIRLTNFTVQSTVPFDVARHTATRIFPFLPYDVNFSIIAYEDYSGGVYEFVPSGFYIFPSALMQVVPDGSAQKIEWSKSFVAGQKYEFGYRYDAPDVSPYFYELGPMQIGSFQEARRWEIASDDKTLTSVSMAAPTTNQTVTVGATFTIQCNPSCSGSGANPTITHTYQYCTTYDCSSGASSISTDSGTGNVLSVGNNPENAACNFNSADTITARNTGTVYIRCHATDGTNTATSSPTIMINVTGDNAPFLSSTQSPNPDKNDSSIFQNDVVFFNVTWEDDYGLRNWTFSWNNTGLWVNITRGKFSGLINYTNTTQTVTATAGTVVGWIFYANDTGNRTGSSGVQTFTVASESDTQAPSITNFRVSPNVTVSAGTVNISATITDNYGVNAAYAEINLPNGTKINYSMSSSGSLWYYLYGTTIGGNFSAVIYAVDGNNNYNNTQGSEKYYNVTSNISTSRFYYGRGERVTVTGLGFSSLSYATVDIKHRSGTSAPGFPATTVSTNASGGFQTTWDIPTSSTAIYNNNYTINATDNTLSWLINKTMIVVVLKPYFANKTDTAGTADVLSSINHSDNSRAGIDAAGGQEDFISMNWTNDFTSLYIINKVEIFIEHVASASDTMAVTWWDGSTYQTVCSFTSGTTEAFNNCTISGINTVAEANNINLRYTDSSGIANKIMYADFVYLLINYSLDTATHVIINQPSRPLIVRNYTDTSNNNAYWGSDATRPPSAITKGTSLTSTELGYMAASDDIKFSSMNETVGSVAYQSFNFKVPEINETIYQFRVLYEGFASKGLASQERATGYSVYLWNYTSGLYSFIQNTSASSLGTDVIFNRTFANFSYFLNSTGDVWLLIENMNASGGGAGEGRSNLTTDYVALELTMVPQLKGIQPINFTATDADGITGCKYRYRNSSSTMSYIFMNNTYQYFWNNISNTATVADGFYYIDANCTDSLSNYNSSEYIYVKVDNSGPNVSLSSPETGSNYSSSSVTVVWNATDSAMGNMLCDVLLNGTKNNSYSLVSIKNWLTSYALTGLNNGHYLWNVNCSDALGNYGSGTARTFIVDTASPTVSLNYPTPGLSVSSSQMTFNYTVEDTATGLANCTLVLDEIANLTNYSISNGAYNYFTVAEINDGTHNWSVNCSDYVGNVGNSSRQNFTIDAGGPTVTAKYPMGHNLTSGTVQFNFTATDTSDPALDCNLSIDGIVNNTGYISATSGADTLNTVSGINEGNHTWNVTCIDDALNPGYSSSANFTIDKPPIITLNFPINYYSSNLQSFSLNYTPSDTYGISNCSIYLDGSLNGTNYSITMNAPNYFNTTSFIEGAHYWQVNCSDNRGTIGNSTYQNFSVDLTKMTINISAPPNGSAWGTSNIQFNFTAIDNIDTYLDCLITVNGATISSGINATSGTRKSTTVGGMTNGQKFWNVTCTDDAGNINTSVTWEFNISSPTTVNLTSPADNYFTTVPNITLYYTANSSNSIVNCSLFINTFYNQSNTTILNTTGGNNNFTLANLSEQSYNWSVFCIDDFNLTGGSQTRKFTVDFSPPNIALNYPANQSNLSVNYTGLNFTATDSVSANFTCNATLDGTKNNSANIIAYNGVMAEYNVTGLLEGYHRWNISCNDLAGNGNVSETYSFNVKLPPRVTLVGPLQNYSTTANNVNFSFIPYDAFGIANCSLYIDNLLNATNSSITTNTTNYINVTGINEGVHNWTIECIDIDSNSVNVSFRNFTIDQTVPFVQLNSPSPGAFYPQGTNVTFNWTATDNFDAALYCNLTIDNIVNVTSVLSYNNQSSTQLVNGLSNTAHYWNVTCWDNADNANTSETRNLTLQEIPTVILNAPLTGSGYSDPNISASYQVFSSIDLANCSFIVGNVVNQTNTSIVQLAGPLSYFNLTNLSEGTYNWTVNCTNVNGVTGGAAVEFFDIDNRTPSLVLVGPANNSVNYLQYVDFQLNATDNVDTNITCNLTIDNIVNISNFGAANGTTTTKRVDNFTEGYHYWNISCWDNVGFLNVSDTWQFYQNFSPSLTLDFPPDGYFTGSASLSFNFTPLDNEVNLLECRLNIDRLQNGTTFSTPASGTQQSRTVSPFNEGVHNWTANCTDNSLNVATRPERIFYVDFTGPTIALHFPNGTSYSQNPVAFNFTPTDNLGTNLTCNVTVNNTVRAGSLSATSGNYYNLTINNFTDGLLFWNATCLDQVSNANTSVMFNFTMQEKPTIILNSPANGTRAKDTNYSFNFTPNDNSYAIANCTLVLNAVANNSNSSINHSLPNLVTADYLTHNSYDWTINCSDQSGNIGTNLSLKRFYVDLLGPGFSLITPSSGETFNYDDIYFNFTALEQFGLNTSISCNLSIDDLVNVTGISLLNSNTSRTLIGNLTQGNHNWTVTCWDDLNNTNTSQTLSFIINAPDLVITTHNITFNNTNPRLNESIQINATIFNIGGISASNFNVYFFDNMNVITIVNVPTLATNANLTVNATWNITAGFHEIMVNISFNGVELNYTNNNATNNLTSLNPRITSPENGTWSRLASNNLTIIVNDYRSSTVNYTIYIDGLTNSSYVASDGAENNYTSNLSEGQHNITIEGTGQRVDAQGLDAGETRRLNSTFFYITIDLTNATVAFVTANNSWFSDATPEFSFSLADNLASLLNYTIYQNGTSFATNSTSNGSAIAINLSLSSEGPWDIVVEAVDLAGNKFNSSPWRINLDTTPPSPNITTANNTNTSDNTPSISFNITDNLATTANYTFYIDFTTVSTSGTASISTLTSANLASLADGYHNITLEATDLAGNKANSSYISIFIDTTPPTISIQNPSEGNAFGYLIDILTTISDNGVGISAASYSLINDSGTIYQTGNLNSTSNWDALWNSSANISESADYVYVMLNVTANDTLGNARNLSVRFIVDNKRPSIVFFAPNGNDYRQDFSLDIRIQNRNLTISTYNITNETFELKVNNSNYSINSQAFNWTDTISIPASSWPEGLYNTTVFALDSVGNNRTSFNYFRIDRTAPAIALHEPIQFFNTSSQSVYFNFSTTDNFDTSMNCNLTINGAVSAQSLAALNGSYTNVTVSSLTQGPKAWNVTCEDNAGNTFTSQTYNFTVDYTPPTILLLAPDNNTFIGSSLVNFSYVPTDNLLGIASCSLIINSSVNMTNLSVVVGQANWFVQSLAEGVYSWTVNCSDSVWNQGTNTSERRIYVDLTPPLPTLTTANKTWFSNSTPNLTFTLTDNYDSIINFTFYVNDTINLTGYVSNGAATGYLIGPLMELDYRIILEGKDDANNTRNSSFIIISIDYTVPNVTLLGPANNSNSSTNDIYFNFTSSDNRAQQLYCNITIDGITNLSGIILNNSLNASSYIQDIPSGYHNWSVNCRDNATNIGYSDTHYFNVTPPDMIITTGNISFNQTAFEENRPFLISANVFNIGDGEALNFKVGFYLNDPDSGGTQLGVNHTISLQPNENKTVNVTASLDIGDFTIFVQVDRDSQVVEESENNNKANKTGNIGSYQIVYGNLSGTLILSLNTSRIFTWDFSNATSGSLFAIDSDSQVSWSGLKAFGRNASNENSSNDFSELDTSLSMTNITDSINRTFTINGYGKNTSNMTIFNRNIIDVPIINTTNSSNFLTGILWDSLDASNGEYNGTQDIVFVSPINRNRLGKYGNYDFEMRVPSKLRQYKTPNADTSVTIYVELR